MKKEVKLDNSNAFDPSRYRLEQNFEASPIQKMVTISVRKPGPECWFQAHPDDKMTFRTRLLECRGSSFLSEFYLVDPELVGQLVREPVFRPKVLVPILSRGGHVLLWPIALPGQDGRLDSWSKSAHDALAKARTEWVRLTPNHATRAYDVLTGYKNEPATWPVLTLEQILQVAFKDRIIHDYDHPVLRNLRGEA